MSPKAISYLLVGVWLLIAVVIITYPLRTGKIRVGLDPVSRASAPKPFWRAYIISTALFLALSVAIWAFVRSIVP
jgi:hypothetical protein